MNAGQPGALLYTHIQVPGPRLFNHEVTARPSTLCGILITQTVDVSTVAAGDPRVDCPACRRHLVERSIKAFQ